MRALILAGLLALGLSFGARAQDACDQTMKPVAEIRAAGVDVIELTPVQRANVEANVNAMPPVSDMKLTHAYVLAKGEQMVLVLVTGANCVAMAGPIDQRTLSKLEKPPGDPV